jgi:hypothetical protein
MSAAATAASDACFIKAPDCVCSVVGRRLDGRLCDGIRCLRTDAREAQVAQYDAVGLCGWVGVPSHPLPDPGSPPRTGRPSPRGEPIRAPPYVPCRAKVPTPLSQDPSQLAAVRWERVRDRGALTWVGACSMFGPRADRHQYLLAADSALAEVWAASATFHHPGSDGSNVSHRQHWNWKGCTSHFNFNSGDPEPPGAACLLDARCRARPSLNYCLIRGDL